MTKAWYKFKITILLSFVFATLNVPAWAHIPGQSLVIINLQKNALDGEIHIFYDDLKSFIPELPARVAKIDLDSLQPFTNTIQNFLRENISIQINEALPLNLEFLPEFQIDDNQNVIMPFQAKSKNPLSGSIKISEQGLFEKKPKFSTLVILNAPQFQRTGILTAQKNSTKLFTTNFSEFVGFLQYGLIHIYAGLDHIMFLVLLIFSPFLGAARRKTNRFLEIFWGIIKSATAFTVAHSLTLTLAVLKICFLPESLIELIILASIIIMGVAHFQNWETRHEWLLVFMFGLFHGYGFSTALTTLGLSPKNIFIPLVGFNLGVEIGQAFILVLILVPLYFLYLRWKGTPHLIRFCCGGITLTAFGWLIVRIVNLF